MRKQFGRKKLLWKWIVVAVLSCLIAMTPTIVQASDPAQLMQQGLESYEAKNYKAAIDFWNQAQNRYRSRNDLINAAIALENIARTYAKQDNNSEAIRTWKDAISIYRQLNNPAKLSQALTEQAQLYSAIGQARQAIALLCAPEMNQNDCTDQGSVKLAEKAKDPAIQIAALGSLGDAYRLSGDSDRAIQTLSAAYTLAKQTNHSTHLLSLLNSLGNAHISRAALRELQADSARGRDLREEKQRKTDAENDTQAAIAFLTDSLRMSQNNPSAKLRSLLSLASIHHRRTETAMMLPYLRTAIPLLEQIDSDRVRAYAAIDIAKLLNADDPKQTEALLMQAIRSAQAIKDFRAESFAAGELGRLYKRNRSEIAITWIKRAISTADQDLEAKDSLYLWEWELGRLLENQGQTQNAIAAYERSIRVLETIRSDILEANRELQFNFRDEIEPIYRNLIALRVGLENISKNPVSKNPVSDARLKQAQPATSMDSNNIDIVLRAMDSLRLAELQNYFGNDCILAAARPSGNLGTDAAAKAVQSALNTATQDGKTAVINYIVLENELVVILNVKNKPPRTETIKVPVKEIEQLITQFRGQLQSNTLEDFDPKASNAQVLYRYLIEPVCPTLKAEGIETLVFAQDGLLRNIPMAALHDGEKFLIQNYAIATVPSLSLVNLSQPKNEPRSALAFRLGEAVEVNGRQYSALIYTKRETQNIVEELPGSIVLPDEKFTKQNLRTALRQRNYPILHLATHGQFGADPKDTFLITGGREELTLIELETILRERSSEDQIELLALTACQTAVGDNRSTLGLAGAAIQAGAKSALASLWFIEDRGTADLVQLFYDGLSGRSQQRLSKAKALQRSQIKLIEDGQHPRLWSAFVLVGNWF
ncbi:TPR repeat protein [Leptolyngbya sp. NIES-3755]|nr:TPR repeat protein [Leptolyngbya sp. NIES-3755]